MYFLNWSSYALEMATLTVKHHYCLGFGVDVGLILTPNIVFNMLSVIRPRGTCSYLFVLNVVLMYYLFLYINTSFVFTFIFSSYVKVLTF